MTYRWDFSDQPEPTFGQQVVRAYAAPGVYTAQLTVTDDSNAINAVDQDEIEIRINHAPVAEAGPDIVVGQSTITFDGSGSADADGDPLTYVWDFGDGSPAAAGALVSHTYAEGGVYPVVLTVDDGTGLSNASDRASVTVTINGAPVADAGGNKDVCAGDVVVFDGSASSDPDGGLLRYRWDFGDGTSAELVNPTKTYDVGAVYPVTLTVRDEFGLRQRQPHRPHRRAGRRVAARGRRTGSGGLRRHRGALRRLGLGRLRRRGESLPMGLRRWCGRRRRQAGARLPAARQLPRRAEHRGRPGRPVQQHRRRRNAGPRRGGAGSPDRRCEQHRRRCSWHLRRQRVLRRHGPDRELALGFR